MGKIAQIVFIYAINMVFSVAITMLITYLAFGQFSWIPWLIGMGTGWINAYIYNMLQKKYGGLFQIKGF